MLKIGEFAALSSISIHMLRHYDKIGLINTVAAEWLEKQHLEIDGLPFMIYHRSPGNCTDDRAFISELCFPVKEKND